MYLRKECNGTFTIKDDDGSNYYGDMIEIGLTLRDLGLSWKEIDIALGALAVDGYKYVTFDSNKKFESAERA